MAKKEVIPTKQVPGRRNFGENPAKGSPLLPELDLQLAKQCRRGGHEQGGWGRAGPEKLEFDLSLEF